MRDGAKLENPSLPDTSAPPPPPSSAPVAPAAPPTPPGPPVSPWNALDGYGLQHANLHHDDHEPVRRTPGAERPVVRHGQAPPMPHCDEAASRVRHPTSAGAVRAAFGLAKTWAMIAGIIRTLGILIAVGSSAPTADARLTWVPHPGPGGGAPRLWAAAWAP